MDNERIHASIRVDGLFKTFEVEMTPAEVLGFAEAAHRAGVPKMAELYNLIERINATIPPANFGPHHPQTGRPHHHYRIGREQGCRILRVEIFKGFFQIDYDFMELLEAIHVLGAAAGAYTAIDSDNNSYSVAMRWPEEKENR